MPPVHAFCDDAGVIGAPFYVMTRLHGIVPHDLDAVRGLTPDQGRALSERFAGVLRAIHGIDIDAVGLGDSPVIDAPAENLWASIPPSPPDPPQPGTRRVLGATMPVQPV